MQYYGINYLINKLNSKEHYVESRYNYYEGKYHVQDFGIATPPKLRSYKLILGWAQKSVDSIANRLKVKKFDNDAFNMEQVFRMNNADILFDSAILGALISGCSFIYISYYDNEPKLQVIDGKNATGIIDPITYFLTEGYAVLERDENDNPTIDAYFTKEETLVRYLKEGREESFPNPTNYPLLVPIINRPDAHKKFGHPVISKSCMNIIQAACRTITRSEINAEFNSTPQKYMVGVSEDLDLESWNAQVSSFLMISKDEDGDSPKIGQFNQTSMSPFIEQLNMFVRLFSGEVNLTPDDLGVVSSNPSSAEAIKASHENMRLYCRDCQNKFQIGFLNVGLLACSIRDGIAYDRARLYDTRVVWMPLFEPDSAMLSSIGDGAIKINQAVPSFFDAETLERLTGIESDIDE